MSLVSKSRDGVGRAVLPGGPAGGGPEDGEQPRRPPGSGSTLASPGTGASPGPVLSTHESQATSRRGHSPASRHRALSNLLGVGSRRVAGPEFQAAWPVCAPAEENGELPRGLRLHTRAPPSLPRGVLVTTSMTGAEQGCKSRGGGTKRGRGGRQWADDAAEAGPATGLTRPLCSAPGSPRTVVTH